MGSVNPYGDRKTITQGPRDFFESFAIGRHNGNETLGRLHHIASFGISPLRRTVGISHGKKKAEDVASGSINFVNNQAAPAGAISAPRSNCGSFEPLPTTLSPRHPRARYVCGRQILSAYQAFRH